MPRPQSTFRTNDGECKLQTRELYEIGTHIFICGYRGIQIYISHIEVEDTNLYVLSIIILICIVIA